MFLWPSMTSNKHAQRRPTSQYPAILILIDLLSLSGSTLRQRSLFCHVSARTHAHQYPSQPPNDPFLSSNTLLSACLSVMQSPILPVYLITLIFTSLVLHCAHTQMHHKVDFYNSHTHPGCGNRGRAAYWWDWWAYRV